MSEAALHDAVLQGFPASPMMRRAFRQMRIADEVLAELSRRWPRARRRIAAAFRHLRSPFLDDVDDAVFRAHAAELAERAARRRDLRPGTLAEACAVFSRASAAAPLEHDHAVAYAMAFRRVLPERAEVAAPLLDAGERVPDEPERILSRLLAKIGERARRPEAASP